MKKTTFFFLVFNLCFFLASGQEDTRLLEKHSGITQDDPSQFITRAELFDKLIWLQSEELLNFTTFRSVIALGHRFSTRFEIPFMYNTVSASGYDQAGLGDISVRLLGYKIRQTPNSAIAASIEFSFNTAQSPLLGTGKNVIVPLISYSRIYSEQKTVVALLYEHLYSVWGDELRQDINWSKFQVYYVKGWSKDVSSIVLPEFIFDYVNGGTSMNLEASVFYKFTGRISIWGKGGVGIFGDHMLRYNYMTEAGIRYFMMRKQPN